MPSALQPRAWPNEKDDYETQTTLQEASGAGPDLPQVRRPKGRRKILSFYHPRAVQGLGAARWPPPEKMKDHDAKFIGEMLSASSEASWTPTLAEMAKLRKIKEAYK